MNTLHQWTILSIWSSTFNNSITNYTVIILHYRRTKLKASTVSAFGNGSSCEQRRTISVNFNIYPYRVE